MAAVLRAVEGVKFEDAAKRRRDYERAVKVYEQWRAKNPRKPPSERTYYDMLGERPRPTPPNLDATHVNVTFANGRKSKICRVSEERFLTSKTTPVVIFRDRDSGRSYWLYKRRLYRTTDRALKPADVLALLTASEARRKISLDRAHAWQQMQDSAETGTRRVPIPKEVKLEVWQRDSGRCVECRSKEDLEFDHIIPLAMGGSNSVRNLQLLCGPCNRDKGAGL